MFCLLILYSVAAHTSTGCDLGCATLGKRGVSAEQVGRQAAEMLVNNLYHGGCVDDFLQDQVSHAHSFVVSLLLSLALVLLIFCLI